MERDARDRPTDSQEKSAVARPDRLHRAHGLEREGRRGWIAPTAFTPTHSRSAPIRRRSFWFGEGGSALISSEGTRPMKDGFGGWAGRLRPRASTARRRPALEPTEDDVGAGPAAGPAAARGG